MVLIERFHPQHTLDVIARHHVTFLHQTPSMYIMEFNLQGYETFNLSSLRAMSVAGAPTPPPVMQKMMQAVPQVFTGYGMTEMVGFITYTEPGDAPDTISYTVGKIAPEFQLKIVDNERQEQPIGTRGEVALRGDCRFYGYFADDSSTREVIDEDSWYYSGDVGVLDERNYLTLVDRKKLMFITGGYNVYPREIEDYVCSYAAVEFAACLPKPHDVMGEVGVLFVKIKDNEAPNAEAIRQHCIAGLAEYKIPREIRFLDDFPLTPLGKIDRQRLRPLV
jgi:acyl-CoA synthetase (AMP-forming)/AMP-acid ligase II